MPKHELNNASFFPQGYSTNAVFKVGDVVLKIFAPPSSGLNAYSEYQTELGALKRAHKNQVPIPKLLHHGLIEDKYPFYYMVFEAIQGKEARDVLPRLSNPQKDDVINQLNVILKRLNERCPIKNEAVKERHKILKRWKNFSLSFQQQITDYVNTLIFNDFYYVHGDITEDNVLITKDNRVYLIDFADSTIAPLIYELPSIIYGLFDLDQDLTKRFIRHQDYDTFINDL